MKNTMFLILFGLLFTLTANAQRSNRFTGRTPPGPVKVIKDSLFVNRTAQLQRIIDGFGNRGGRIEISGEITLGNIQINKNNIHIDIKRGTTIKIAGGASTVFSVNNRKEGGPQISNIKIGCSNCDNKFASNDAPGKRYVIDLSARRPNTKANAISLGNVRNFSISHLYARDNYTKINAIVCAAVVVTPPGDRDIPRFRKNLDVQGGPRDGDITYCHVNKGHSGYGLVQTQAAMNVNFHYLSGVGGVTLRIESGSVIAFVPTNEGRKARLDRIDGFEIKNKKGFAAILLQPHGAKQGTVVLKNIRSESSASNIDISPGFRDRALAGLPDREFGCNTCKFKRGTFERVTLQGVISHKFGNKAQNEAKLYNYYSKEFRDGASYAEKFAARRFASPFSSTIEARSNTPSIVNILYSAADRGRTPVASEGQYRVFLGGADIRSTRLEGFESCTKNILYKSDLKKVACERDAPPSQRNRSLNNRTEGNSIYPNPVSEMLTINYPENSQVTIYNNLGTIIEKFAIKEVTRNMSVNHLSGGIYFARILLNGKEITEKIIIK
ncbi:T9SS type A sorting domain-containing protein [Aquimarina sp. ERC-38]|uniref:T9SS type A sorting domain-containing protein n=1 Tax=Aquimarina sp. ERC-38 TaxID=2949996 RepID=UPI002246F0C5|nr:T9SS type A sorting domain-containing protein [Aquimarina sp. ERC-38]UZO80599.1 T9SS type A sorting domain-containing protein [Aquimarina sp. ERC-38]